MASDLEQAAKPCQLCANLSLLKLSPDVKETTIRDLEISATSCQLCKMLQDVVEFYEPRKNARGAGSLMWERGSLWPDKDEDEDNKLNLGPRFLWLPNQGSEDVNRGLRAFTLRRKHRPPPLMTLIDLQLSGRWKCSATTSVCTFRTADIWTYRSRRKSHLGKTANKLV